MLMIRKEKEVARGKAEKGKRKEQEEVNKRNKKR